MVWRYGRYRRRGRYGSRSGVTRRRYGSKYRRRNRGPRFRGRRRYVGRRRSRRRFGLAGRLPRTTYKKHYFVQSGVVLDPAASLDTVGKMYRLNGVSDPDASGGGHQPRGYDQMQFFYAQYEVVYAKIRVTFEAGDYAAFGGISIHDDPSPTNTKTNDYMEGAEWARWRNLPNVAAGQMPLNLSMRVRPRRFWRTRSDGGNWISPTTETGVPLNQVYARVWAGSRSASVNPVGVTCTVGITYYVKYTSPVTFAQSTAST